MYKIYKVCGKGRFTRIFYSLCDENTTVIKWFHTSINCTCPFRIFDDDGTSKLNDVYSTDELKCIYESFDLQEASDQLEQLRVLESV